MVDVKQGFSDKLQLFWRQVVRVFTDLDVLDGWVIFDVLDSSIPIRIGVCGRGFDTSFGNSI